MRNKMSSRKLSIEEFIYSGSNHFISLVDEQSFLSLRPESRPKKYEDDPLRVMGAMENKTSLNQLWLFKPLKGGSRYEIVNFETDLVLDSDDDIVRLERGKQKPSQGFYVEMVKKGKEDVDLIKLKDYNGYYLLLDGVLCLSRVKESDDAHIFRRIYRNDAELYKSLSHLKTIYDPTSKERCLDVSGGDHKEGTEVILYQHNIRANQYWVFIPPLKEEEIDPQNYSIMNFLTRLYLDIRDGQVVQTSNNEGMWQLRKKHNCSGELFHKKAKQYIVSGDDAKLLLREDMGVRWEIA